MPSPVLEIVEHDNSLQFKARTCRGRRVRCVGQGGAEGPEQAGAASASASGAARRRGGGRGSPPFSSSSLPRHRAGRCSPAKDDCRGGDGGAPPRASASRRSLAAAARRRLLRALPCGGGGGGGRGRHDGARLCLSLAAGRWVGLLTGGQPFTSPAHVCAAETLTATGAPGTGYRAAVAAAAKIVIF